MRHRIAGKQLSRTSEHRRAMLRNLAAGLFEHGAIETTMPKAKAVQPFVEKIITTAKKGTFNARRTIEQRINDRKIHSWVADPNVPESRKDNPYFELPDESDIKFNRYGDVKKAPRLVEHIMKNVAPLFEDRDGGYTRIVRTGKHRFGDGTDLVILELVGQEDGPEIGGGTSRRREIADKRTAFAAKLRKGKDKPDAKKSDDTEAEAPEVVEAGETVAETTGEEPVADAVESEAMDDDSAAESKKSDD